MRDLLHITLDTGDVAMIPRGHLKASTLPVMRRILAELAVGREADIPQPGDVPGRWRINAGAEPGRCLSAQIMYCGSPAGTRERWDGVVWFCVARHSRCGATVWRSMHQMPASQTKTNPARQPATPWLATRILPAIIRVPATERDIAWIADFSECLALAWLIDAEDTTL